MAVQEPVPASGVAVDPVPPVFPPLLPEDVLAVADEVCAAYGTTVRSLAAVCAVTAVVDAHIAGISVYRSEDSRSRTVRDSVERLGPIRGAAANRAFAEALLNVIRHEPA